MFGQHFSKPIKFQFTHPGGVRHLLRYQFSLSNRFQFTHPGGVRLRGVDVAVATLDVSIHAPGRGATEALLDERAVVVVSIHAPGRGATNISAEVEHHSRVSIHAPGRGATESVKRF